METLRYNGQNVYTNGLNRATNKDLERAKEGQGTICDAYFFEIDGDRRVIKTEFDRAKIEALQVGLSVEVKSQFGGQASVAIAGLERITQFIYDTGVLGKDLSVLIGRTVTEYDRGIQLLGIGIQS